MPSPGAATDVSKKHQMVTANDMEPQGLLKISVNALYKSSSMVLYMAACASGLLNIGNLLASVPGVRLKVHELRCRIVAYLVRTQRASSSQTLLLMLKLAGWTLVFLSAADRLRRAAPSTISIVHDVKRALKFDDQDDASDASAHPADTDGSEEIVESANDAEELAEATTDWDTFWARKPTRDMIRTLSSQEVESNKTDLTVARLDEWMLKFTTFARRRYPQFGELLEIVWTLGDLEEATSLVTTSILASDANIWGASALMSVIDVTKPAGKVFEAAMLDAERAIAGTMSSGIEIAVRIAK